jgi:hypothetical protein
MSENAMDSENINKPAPDKAKPKGARKSVKKYGRWFCRVARAPKPAKLTP